MENIIYKKTMSTDYVEVNETTTRIHMNPKEALGSLEHVRNKEFRNKEDHVDAYGGEFEVWKDESVYDAYNNVFGEYIRAYNDKQRRKSRKILDANGDPVGGYIESIQTSRRGKKERAVYKNMPDGTKEVVGRRQESQGQRVVYEMVVSSGNCEKKRDEHGRVVYTDDGHEIHPNRVPYEVNKAAVKEFYNQFERFYPHLHLTTVAWHADEYYLNANGVKEYGIEHAHLCFIPWADGYQRGLPVQASISKALAQMGFVDGTDEEGIWHNAYWYFTQDAQERFEEILNNEYMKYQKEHGVTYGGDSILASMGCAPGLFFMYPAKGKNLQNLDPAAFRALKDVGRQIGIAQAELDAVENRIDAKKNKEEELDDAIFDKTEKFGEVVFRYKLLREECEKLDKKLEDFKERAENITKDDFDFYIGDKDVRNWMNTHTITDRKTGKTTTFANRCLADLLKAKAEKAKADAKAAEELQEKIRQMERQIAETVQKALPESDSDESDTEDDDTKKDDTEHDL